MAAQFSRFDIKTSNSASTSQPQPLLLCAPSSSTLRNLDLNELPVPEEDQPAPIQIDDPRAVESSGGLSAYSFQDVRTFKDFHIVFKGVCVDNQLPDDIRSGYYRLCFKEKEFLHSGIPKHHFPKLVVGMIGQTVNISREIKNCSLSTTTKEELDSWDKTLVGFELLGMNVKFLREKIHALGTIMTEAAVDIQNYRKAANDLKLIEDEIPRVAANIKKLRQMAMEIEGDLCSSEQKAEEYKNKLQELVNKPW